MKRHGISAFVILCVVLTLLTLLYMGGNLAVITVRGLQSLPDKLMLPETLFAVRLSVRSACISTLLCFVLAIPTAYIL
ncbi:MAG: nitrogen fixation protein NifC, partial [Oscillospiraceae bacterium]|nr:nitrogen fixation protein NifC [Oscillospiraceae bacterium]